MKKFILLAAVIGITTAVYQPVKAQVSINVNIGRPAYYGYSSYYVPAQPVYVERNVRYHRSNNYYPQRNVVVYRAQPVHRSYYNNYRPSSRYYSVKNVNYKHYNKSYKHSRGNGHGKGRH